MIERKDYSPLSNFLKYFSTHFNTSIPGNILWSHAVNDQEKLQKVLEDPSVMIIESDIRYTPNGNIIATHPPSMESNLDMQELLLAV